MKKINSNTIFLLVATLVVAGGLYWYFFSGRGGEGGALTAGSPTQFEILIGQLGPITFDLTILSDPRFLGLTDLSTPVEPEVIGRKDPFAPITGVAGQ